MRKKLNSIPIGEAASSLFLILLVLIIFSASVFGQHLVIFTNLADVMGLPGTLKVRQANKRVDISYRSYEAHEHHLHNGEQARIAQGLASIKSHPVLHAVENVCLNFIDKKYRKPVTSLTVQLTVITRRGRSTMTRTTNPAGRITISNITPLPAAIDIVVMPTLVDGVVQPAWELASPQLASIDIDQASGQRLARVRAPYLIASSSYRLPSRPSHSTNYQIYQLSKSIPLTHDFVDFAISAPADIQIWYSSPDRLSGGGAIPSQMISGISSANETAVSVTKDEQVCRFTLPVSILQDGCVPLRLSRQSSAGMFEAVIDNYPDDPYTVNTIVLPIMNLVAVNSVQLPDDINVLSRASDVDALFPDLDKHAGASANDRLQGSDWWKSDYPAVSFRIRRSPFSNDDTQSLVECIRLDKADAGSVAGIRVGMPKQDLVNTLGDGIETYDSVSYLDGGVTFALDGDTVKSIYVDRPRELLEQGTTAFVPRKPAKVFVKSFHVDGRWSGGMAISNLDELKSYLVRTGVVQLVDNEQDADYTLTCEASNLIEKKDVPLGLIPLQYDCGMTLTYSLRDDATGQTVYSDKTVSSEEKVDFWQLLVPIIAGVAIVNKASHNDVTNTIADALGVAFIASLKDAADKADRTCPRLVEQEAYSRMADDLYDAFDCRCRVTAIDYNRGLLTMNVGTADGVVAEGDNRTTFEILVNTDRGPTPLPSSEGGMSADYYIAEVLSAGDHTCTCELEHVTHSVKIRYGLFGKSYVADNTNVKNDIDMLRRIPDPTTGIVSARIKSRLLPLPMPPTN